MSFEDQLRSETHQIDYSDRDKLLRDAAKKSVLQFQDNCLSYARLGKISCDTPAGYKEWINLYLVYAIPDERYEATLARSMADSILRNCVYLKLSEAETFMTYIRQEFQLCNMPSAKVSLKECFSEYRKTGLFGSTKQVRHKLYRYEFRLSMSW